MLDASYYASLGLADVLDKVLAGQRLSAEDGMALFACPDITAVGALALYISNESVVDFQPMNVNFGIIPPLGYRVKGKRNKNAALSQRALEALDGLDWR